MAAGPHTDAIGDVVDDAVRDAELSGVLDPDGGGRPTGDRQAVKDHVIVGHDNAVASVDARAVENRRLAGKGRERDLRTCGAATRRAKSLAIRPSPEVDERARRRRLGGELGRCPWAVDRSRVAVAPVRGDIDLPAVLARVDRCSGRAA